MALETFIDIVCGVVTREDAGKGIAGKWPKKGS